MVPIQSDRALEDLQRRIRKFPNADVQSLSHHTQKTVFVVFQLNTALRVWYLYNVIIFNTFAYK